MSCYVCGKDLIDQSSDQILPKKTEINLRRIDQLFDLILPRLNKENWKTKSLMIC